jgi:hypothetical protein
MRKPPYLPQDKWTDLLQRHGGVPRCAITGETDELSVDHIVPLYDGGTDDVSNLQFLKKELNSRKGVRPDRYWSQHFYFDNKPSLQNCRGAQGDLYQAMMAQADWFSEPVSNIARLLYTFPIVVGGGKTLSAVMASCAYNAIVRARWGAARRADRILILTKERAIRNQIARDLRIDPTRFGIMPIKPVVDIIQRGSQFDFKPWLMSRDILVACIHQLWDGSRDLAKLLHRFPVIVIDEPHYAVDRVMAIVEKATTSICFGMTGSPIDAFGALLPSMVNVFSYGYQDANENDKSVKYLSAVNWQHHHVKMAKLAEAELLDAGQIATRTDTGSLGYERNFEPAKSVAMEVIRHMQRCDELPAQEPTKAPHREHQDCTVSVFYPVHALICCDNVSFAKRLQQTINNTFDKDRVRFPRQDGWFAEVVHAEGEEPDGTERKDQPQLPNHPWLLSKDRPGYRVDSRCARILLVVGMGREGVNNPLCGVVGVTSDSASAIEVVQRILGRQIRSVTHLTEDGKLCVPPAELDTVTIVTHEVFNPILDSIEDGVNYIVNMDHHLEGLMTINDLVQGDDPIERQDREIGVVLPFSDRIQIAAFLGQNPNASDADVEVMIEHFARGNEKIKGVIADWISLVRSSPAEARAKLRLDCNLEPIKTVLYEELNHTPTDAQLTAFLRAIKPNLAQRRIEDSNRDAFLELYRDHAKAVYASTPVTLNPDGSHRDIDQIRKSIGGTIIRDLGVHYVKTKELDDRLWNLVGTAVKRKLDVPSVEKAGKGSKWDIANCHAILNCPRPGKRSGRGSLAS